jgi:hypothetical protein
MFWSRTSGHCLIDHLKILLAMLVIRDGPMLNRATQLTPNVRVSLDSDNLKILVNEASVADLSTFCRSRRVILMDRTSITSELKHLSEVDPYFLRRDVFGFVQMVTRRVARRISRKLAASWTAPGELVAEAIYFHLWAELCTIIALRRVARMIAAKAKHQVVFVVLPRLDFECLKLWAVNELEPLILCLALQRQGCKTFLFCPTPVSDGDLTVTLRCSPMGLSTYHWGHTVVAPEGMRGLDELFCEIESASRPLVSARSLAQRTFNPSSECREVSIRLQKADQSNFPPFAEYSLSLPEDPFVAYLGLLEPNFGSILTHVRSLVANSVIEKAYICDHPFLGSCILAHAVKEGGGSVVLWPHSSNVSRVAKERNAKYFDEVVVLTQAAKKNWNDAFSDMPVRINPLIMFPSQSSLRVFDPSEPLNVVVFGGAHFLGRLPLVRIESHIKTYRRLFFRLSTAEGVRLRFKPKACWEDADWFRSNFIELSQSIHVETSPATLLRYSNMIFVSIGHGSTALLEGIACAVPCMIAREQDLADYIDVGDVIPIGTVENIWKLITKCRDGSAYNELLEAQIAWFRVQTSRNQILDAISSRIGAN